MAKATVPAPSPGWLGPGAGGSAWGMGRRPDPREPPTPSPPAPPRPPRPKRPPPLADDDVPLVAFVAAPVWVVAPSSPQAATTDTSEPAQTSAAPYRSAWRDIPIAFRSSTSGRRRRPAL